MAGAKRQKSIIFRIIILVFAIYTVTSLTTLQIRLIETKNELNSITSQIEQKEIKNQELQRLLENGTEKDFIERAARDRLGYVYADEVVYTDVTGS